MHYCLYLAGRRTRLYQRCRSLSGSSSFINNTFGQLETCSELVHTIRYDSIRNNQSASKSRLTVYLIYRNKSQKNEKKKVKQNVQSSEENGR